MPYQLRTTRRGAREGQIDGKVSQAMASDGIRRPQVARSEQIEIRGAHILRIAGWIFEEGGDLPETPPPQELKNEEDTLRPEIDTRDLAESGAVLVPQQGEYDRSNGLRRE